MEQHHRSRQQSGRLNYGQQHRDDGVSGQSQPPAVEPNEGFRPLDYVTQPPVSASISGRIDSEPANMYGGASSQYGAGPEIQPSPVHYVQGASSAEAARQQSQQYPQYGASLMYAMGAPQGIQATSSSYEQASLYRPRPGSGSETMATPLGVAQYYLAGQPVSAGGNVAELASQNIPAHYSPSDTYPVTGSSAMHSFPTSALDPPQSATYNPYTQQVQYTSQMQIPPDDSLFDNYQLQIRNIFTLARDGALRDVGARLFEVSQYLLGNVESLGLTRDDETLRDGRIQLWDEFNRAWLVSLQRQLDLSQRAMQTNQPLEGMQSIMDHQTLERLSNELVKLCDNVEKHGLVDYQMGVAEEEIIELLLRCQSVLNGSGTTTDPASEAPIAGPSSRR